MVGSVSERNSLVAFHGSLDPTFGIAFADISPAIMLFFSFAYSKFQLYKLPLTIQANRDQSQAFSTGFSDKTGNITLLKEEFPGTSIFMRDFFPSVAVAGDEGIGEEELVTVDSDESPLEARMASFDALDLGAGQDNASLVVILETVIKSGSSVVSDDFYHTT